MKYAVEMGSGTMIYIPSFTKIGSGIRKLIGDTQTAWRSHKPTLGKSGENEKRSFAIKMGYTNLYND
jgi:hypothetical protein